MAVISVSPTPTYFTRPLPSTVATLTSPLDQRMPVSVALSGWMVAESCSMAPASWVVEMPPAVISTYLVWRGATVTTQ